MNLGKELVDENQLQIYTSMQKKMIAESLAKPWNVINMLKKGRFRY
jgi:hypothetical protein